MFSSHKDVIKGLIFITVPTETLLKSLSHMMTLSILYFITIQATEFHVDLMNMTMFF
jgi:hypothetical protein